MFELHELAGEVVALDWFWDQGGTSESHQVGQGPRRQPLRRPSAVWRSADACWGDRGLDIVCLHIVIFLFYTEKEMTHLQTCVLAHIYTHTRAYTRLFAVPVAVDESIEGQSIIPATGEVNHVDLGTKIMDIRGPVCECSTTPALQHCCHTALVSIFTAMCQIKCIFFVIKLDFNC